MSARPCRNCSSVTRPAVTSSARSSRSGNSTPQLLEVLHARVVERALLAQDARERERRAVELHHALVLGARDVAGLEQDLGRAGGLAQVTRHALRADHLGFGDQPFLDQQLFQLRHRGRCAHRSSLTRCSRSIPSQVSLGRPRRKLTATDPIVPRLRRNAHAACKLHDDETVAAAQLARLATDTGSDESRQGASERSGRTRMVAIIGIVVVIGSVVGGFTIAGGKLMALFHVSEIVVIVGTAAGTVLISTPLPTCCRISSASWSRCCQPSPFTQDAVPRRAQDAVRAVPARAPRRPGGDRVAHRRPRQERAVQEVPGRAEAASRHGLPVRLAAAGAGRQRAAARSRAAARTTRSTCTTSRRRGRPRRCSRSATRCPASASSPPCSASWSRWAPSPARSSRSASTSAAALTGTFLGVLLAYGFAGPLSDRHRERQPAPSRASTTS